MGLWIRISIFYVLLAGCLSAEAEELYLSNIQQITFSEMGFERAGEAYFSPDGTKIVFQAVAKGESEYQIYLMDLQEKIPHLVSTGVGACTCAFFHPEGEKIIFASSHSDPNPKNEKEPHNGYKWELTPYMNIYEANLDGSALKALTSGPDYHAECAYSPNGQQIVYASNESGCMNLYVMDADGANKRQLTFSEKGVYNGGPFFSPDGSKIVFRADKELPGFLQIYLFDLQSKQEIKLTASNAVNWAPYWHPEGEAIVFTTSIHGHHRYEVYFLHIATNRWHRITDHQDFDGIAVFNQDGNKLMWTSKRSLDNTCQIFIADFKNPSVSDD